MIGATELDSQVDRAIRADDEPALKRITSDFAIWKRGYTRDLVIHRANACLHAFIDSGHKDLVWLARDVATYSTDRNLMHAAAALEQTANQDPEQLIDILDSRTDLTERECENMRRAVVGMDYVN